MSVQTNGCHTLWECDTRWRCAVERLVGEGLHERVERRGAILGGRGKVIAAACPGKKRAVRVFDLQVAGLGAPRTKLRVRWKDAAGGVACRDLQSALGIRGTARDRELDKDFVAARV